MSRLLASLTLAAQDFLAPLLEELRSPEGIEHLFYRHGWQASIDDATFAQVDAALGLRADLESFFAALSPIRGTLADPGTEVSSADLLPLAEAVLKIVDRIAAFDGSALQHLPPPIGDGAAWESILDAVFDGLLEDYLRVYHPLAHLVLVVGGVLDHVSVAPNSDGQVTAIRAKIDWDQLGRLVSDPTGALRATYHWNTPGSDFDTTRLFDALDRSFTALRIVTQPLYPSLQLDRQGVGASAARVDSERAGQRTTLLRGLKQPSLIDWELGFDLWPTTDVVGGQRVDGLLMVPRIVGGAGGTFPISSSLDARYALTTDGGGTLAVLVNPAERQLAEGAARFSVAVSLAAHGDEPQPLIGSGDGARIELRRALLTAEVKGTPDEAELRVAAGSADPAAGLDVVVPLSQSDSFVRGVARRDELRLSFHAGVAWSSRSGLLFNGSPLPQISVPANIELGPITLQRLKIAIDGQSPRADRSGIALRAGLSFKTHLGPVEAVVEDLGFLIGATPYSRQELRSNPPAGDFRLGNVVFDVAMSGPTGVGLVVKGGVVSGGGFLRFDPERGEYAGALELNFASVSLKAIVMLSTKVEGAPFALLAMVYARFPGGLELGLRFTLNAVGGMIGINRGFDYQALVAGLPSGALDALLFPDNPVADAPRILAALGSICPVRPGAYTLALMAELGWGSDYICALRLGIVLPLDDLRRLYLVGQVRVTCFRHLPENIRLQLLCNATGEVGLDPFSLRIDGRLRDSRFGPIGIEGQLVMLLTTGNNPRFLIAAGGFHPNFKSIPAGLPAKIDRLAVSYEVGRFKAWFTGYFALAAGTVQFGAEVGCRYKAGSLAFAGNLGMDALIHLDPFQFEAEVRFNAAVEYRGHELFGVHVRATLWGPDRWRIKGHGSFSILFWDVDIDFDESWGDNVLPAAEPIVLLDKAAEDLWNDTYWEFEAPAAAGAVHLASPAQGAGSAVHPLATLSYRQRRFPLGMALDRVGSSPIAGPRTVPVPAFFTTDDHKIEGDTALEPFAPGEYLDLADDARLTRPSFEPLPAGVAAGISGFSLGPGPEVQADIDYEEFFLPRMKRFEPEFHLVDLHHDLIVKLVANEAAGKSPVRLKERLAKRHEQVVKREPIWAAADLATLAPVATEAPRWTSHAPSALAQARAAATAVPVEAFEMAV